MIILHFNSKHEQNKLRLQNGARTKRAMEEMALEKIKYTLVKHLMAMLEIKIIILKLRI